MRSMYSGVSGLKAHQTKMDVIGNNIANVNTIAYKKGQVTFQEVFSEAIRGAGAPQEGKGGTNPQQIGLGVNIGSINTIHTKGPAQRTDNPTDLMIDGEGFFVVSDDSDNENRYYTRAGNFSLDRDGNLVTPDGCKVLGYTSDDGKIGTSIGSMKINRSETAAPITTKNLELRGNLDSRTGITVDDEYKTDTIIKDSLGNSYLVRFKFKNLGLDKDNTKWSLTLDDVIDEASGKSIMWDIDADGNKTDNGTCGLAWDITTDGLMFSNEGKLISKNADGSFPELKLDIKKDGVKFGNADLINIDYKSLTQYANDTDAKPYAMNGNSSGNLSGFSIDASGVITGMFTNGEKKALGQVLLAKFDNPMGLEKLGNNFFIDTRNSGEPQVGKAGTSGFGAIRPGTLEMSNVDLAAEFTEMITTQRGFQANSRIITTSDEMLQELVNMKR